MTLIERLVEEVQSDFAASGRNDAGSSGAPDAGQAHADEPRESASEQGGLSVDPGLGRREDVLGVHSEEYVSTVEALSKGLAVPEDVASSFGFGPGDNPPFAGMYEAALAYVAGTVAAAERVLEGDRLAFNLAGGLHHALRARASGFCVFNDPAIAVGVLLGERKANSPGFTTPGSSASPFSRVAYVDIDVHHGDGVQWIWRDDPRVLTCSIHEDPRFLFPGTGAVDEVGTCFTSLNVPLEPYTSGDVWLWAFDEAICPALDVFEPQVVVLQMGTDAHFSDPLAHLQVSVQEWYLAIMRVKALGVPIVALGGGGYNLNAVPRMWATAVLSLSDVPFDDRIPADLAEVWGVSKLFDPNPPGPSGLGRRSAERVVQWNRENLLPRIPRP